MHATGWAVVIWDEISVRTVSDTRRNAIVNWLVIDRDIKIYDTTSDEIIEECWHKLSLLSGAQAIPVTVSAPLRGLK